MKQLWLAIKDLPPEGKEIIINDQSVWQSPIDEFALPYTIKEDADEITDRLRRVLKASQGVRRLGAAALDLAYLAAGRFDAFYEQGLKPWDTAAGWLLVNEAGGWVTQYDPSNDFELYAKGILASNTVLHAQIAKLL